MANLRILPTSPQERGASPFLWQTDDTLDAVRACHYHRDQETCPESPLSCRIETSRAHNYGKRVYTLTDTTDQPKLTIGESIRTLLTSSRGYLLVNAANFGDGVAYFGILALMTLFMNKSVGFSTHWSTVSISLFSGAVTIFMALGGGWISDRLGVRRALTFCWMLLVVGRVVFVLSPQASTAYLVGAMAWLGIFIMAAGEGVIQPALYSGVKEYTDERSKTLGYAFLYSIMNLGIVAGELLSPLIRGYWARHVEGEDISQNPSAGIAGAYWFFILITVGMLLVNVLFFTRRVEKRDRRVVRQSKFDAETTWLDKFRNLPIMDCRFLFFIFVLLPVRTLFAHQFLTMPLFVERVYPATVAAKWEWVYMINPIIIVVFVPTIAAVTLKREVVDMMIFGTAITAFSSFLLCGEASVFWLLVYMVVFSFGEAVWSSRFLEYIADIAPVERVGVYMGIATIPWFLAKMCTGFYAGFMLDWFVPETGVQSPQTLWLLYGLVALISPIALLATRTWLVSGVKHEEVEQVKPTK
jgi:MFS family permease